MIVILMKDTDINRAAAKCFEGKSDILKFGDRLSSSTGEGLILLDLSEPSAKDTFKAFQYRHTPKVIVNQLLSDDLPTTIKQIDLLINDFPHERPDSHDPMNLVQFAANMALLFSEAGREITVRCISDLYSSGATVLKAPETGTEVWEVYGHSLSSTDSKASGEFFHKTPTTRSLWKGRDLEDWMKVFPRTQHPPKDKKLFLIT